MALTKKDYEKIYEFLEEKKNSDCKVVYAGQIAKAIGVDRIGGATMAKLAREGKIKKFIRAGQWIIK